MADIPWPKKAVPLTVEGFAKFYEDLCVDLAVARVIADELEADGKRVFHHVFRMTKRQKPLIDNIDDAEFQERVAELIKELRSDAPGTMRLHPARPQPPKTKGHNGDGVQIDGLTCGSKIGRAGGNPSTPTPAPTPPGSA